MIIRQEKSILPTVLGSSALVCGFLAVAWHSANQKVDEEGLYKNHISSSEAECRFNVDPKDDQKVLSVWVVEFNKHYKDPQGNGGECDRPECTIFYESPSKWWGGEVMEQLSSATVYRRMMSASGETWYLKFQLRANDEESRRCKLFNEESGSRGVKSYEARSVNTPQVEFPASWNVFGCSRKEKTAEEKAICSEANPPKAALKNLSPWAFLLPYLGQK